MHTLLLPKLETGAVWRLVWQTGQRQRQRQPEPGALRIVDCYRMEVVYNGGVWGVLVPWKVFSFLLLFFVCQMAVAIAT